VHWVRELGHSILGASRVALVLGVVAAACSGRSVDTAPKSCAADGDCASGQRCDVPADRPAIGMAPCARVVLCSDTVDTCQPDQVCAPGWQTLPDYPYCGDRLCASPCTAASCPPDAACGTDGLCELTSCAEPGAEPCPDFWRCDPESATTASHEPALGSAITESALEIERYMNRGCVRESCAEPGGHECQAAWSCTPDATTNPSGCVPDECEVTGHCADDATLICRAKAQHFDHARST
jgi:hypothetical protein